MAGSRYQCVICGNIQIPFTRIGGGCLCSRCEQELLTATPCQPGYLLRARLVGECFSHQVQRLLRGDLS